MAVKKYAVYIEEARERKMGLFSLPTAHCIPALEMFGL